MTCKPLSRPKFRPPLPVLDGLRDCPRCGGYLYTDKDDTARHCMNCSRYFDDEGNQLVAETSRPAFVSRGKYERRSNNG